MTKNSKLHFFTRLLPVALSLLLLIGTGTRAEDLQWETLKWPEESNQSCQSLIDPLGTVFTDSLKTLEKDLGVNPEVSVNIKRTSVPHLKILWPSMTMPFSVIGNIKGIVAYELRGFCTDVMEMAKTPGQQLLIVTSTKMEPATVKNCLKRVLLYDEAVESAFKRISFFDADNPSPLPLSQKIAPSTFRFKELKKKVSELTQEGALPSYMKTFVTTPLEGWVALELGSSIFGNPQVNGFVEPKSNYHRRAEKASVQKASAIIDIDTKEKLFSALYSMTKQGFKKLMLKMNFGTSGMGNASIEWTDLEFSEINDENLSQVEKNALIERSLLQKLKPANTELSTTDFIKDLLNGGGVVEQFIPNIELLDDENPWSPSGQFDVYSEYVQVRGCHEQKFMPGKEGVYEGALYMSSPEICAQIYEIGLKVGSELRKQGYRGRFAIDTVVTKDPKTKDLKVWLVEINARSGGTHTVDAMVALTDALQVHPNDVPDGLSAYQWYVKDLEGRPRGLYSEGTDNFSHEGLKTFCSDQELLDFIYTTDFSKYGASEEIPLADISNKKGILPHMIQGRSYGKMGFQAIEWDHIDNARSLFSQFKQAFSLALDDRELSHSRCQK